MKARARPDPMDAASPRRRAAVPVSDVSPPEGRVRLPRPLGTLVTLLDKALALFWNNPLLYLMLIGVAVWAGVWGFTDFYGPQYPRVPWYTWLFVPDSPLSTTSWIFASLVIKMGLDKRADAGGKATAFFANWSAMMNTKVGLWTVFVLLYFYDHFFQPGREWFQWMLVVAHLGMVVFAVMLFRKVRALPLAGYVGILALGFLWDFMDYYFVHFFLPGSGYIIFPEGVPHDEGPIRNVVAPVTVGLTLLSTLALAIGMRLRGPPVER